MNVRWIEKGEKMISFSFQRLIIITIIENSAKISLDSSLSTYFKHLKFKL